jgi:hypothetical protein
VSFLTNLAGSGAGIIAIAAGLLILQHHARTPQIAHPWLRRFAIVLMYAGGAALAVTSLGHLADDAITKVAGYFGGLGYGLAHDAIVIGILVLLAGAVLGLISDADSSTAMVAAFLPILLALPLGGFIHEVYGVLNGPALDLASTVNHFLAG